MMDWLTGEEEAILILPRAQEDGEGSPPHSSSGQESSLEWPNSRGTRKSCHLASTIRKLKYKIDAGSVKIPCRLGNSSFPPPQAVSSLKSNIGKPPSLSDRGGHFPSIPLRPPPPPPPPPSLFSSIDIGFRRWGGKFRLGDLGGDQDGYNFRSGDGLGSSGGGEGGEGLIERSPLQLRGEEGVRGGEDDIFCVLLFQLFGKQDTPTKENTQSGGGILIRINGTVVRTGLLLVNKGHLSPPFFVCLFCVYVVRITHAFFFPLSVLLRVRTQWFPA